jgi:stage V sporulation protein G
MKHQISEVQILPIKPKDGLVAIASLVLDYDFYLGSIGVVTRPSGGYRLLYPTKKIGERNINLFHPINRETAVEIEEVIIRRFEEVMNHDRHNQIDTG